MTTLVVDSKHLGPPESVWRSTAPLNALRSLGPLVGRRLVIVAPHPDDEVFGAGGLLQSALALRMPVALLAVTDGEASHPRAAMEQSLDVRSIRVGESQRALARLGWTQPDVTRMGLPDGHVSEFQHQLVDALSDLLRDGDVCVAPWVRDGHPDHDACGRAARSATGMRNVRLLEYLVWAWHWADPHGEDIPWRSCRRLELSRRMAARKRWATGVYVSQTSTGGIDRGEAVLPSQILRRFWRPFEVFITTGGV
jgi:LmbE family N-acetylglucosaminyl deacetylase